MNIALFSHYVVDDNVDNNAGDLSQLELSNKVCGSNEPVEANIGVKRKISEYLIFMFPFFKFFCAQMSLKYRKILKLFSPPSVSLTEKLKKVGKRKKDQHVSKEIKFVKSLGDVDSEEVDQISAVDEDCSRGMKSIEPPF